MADNRKIYKEAVRTFGHAAQTDMAVKECASLIAEIQKNKLMRPANVPQAIADMEIMCAQLRIIFPGVPAIKHQRMEKLEELILKRKGATVENQQT